MNPESELLGDRPVRLPRARERYREPRPERTRPDLTGRAARWCGAILVVLLIATTVAVMDSSARTREQAGVAGCQDRLRAATGDAERRLGLVTNYVEPTLAGGRVQVLHLADLMSKRARRVLPAVQAADRFCRGVEVRPWHFSLVARQSASTAYAAALVTLVQTVAAQGRAPFRADATLGRLRAEVGVDGG